ncbi:endonuclease domain-containing 1 protein-like [Triplophysa dalaica]|uniref:endonuclease domain-containing 1 protein-like n=1 Tax=Triplophysa dalaica TaxID=1582913 RepID=UPI0024DF9CFA|nr:endonuclease domain-containing 1 protein-like [Triplophysa dalaica]
MRLLVESVVCVLLPLSFPGIVSRLEKSFTACDDLFFQGKSPVIPGLLENSVTLDKRYKIICQTYKDKIRFATLYDTDNKIPVFSAYKYTGTNEFMKPEIPRIWMTEDQLEQHSDPEMQYPFQYQARNEDYWIKDRGIKSEVTRGTLFSMKHTADLETAESTFTLTNTVPEEVGFRERIGTLENEFKNLMDNNCLDNNNKIAAYVLTGATPAILNASSVPQRLGKRLGRRSASSKCLELVLSKLPEVYEPVMSNLPEVFKPVLSGLPEVFKPVLSGLPEVFKPVLSGLPVVFEPILSGLPEVFEAVLFGLPEFSEPVPSGLPDVNMSPGHTFLE